MNKQCFYLFIKDFSAVLITILRKHFGTNVYQIHQLFWLVTEYQCIFEGSVVYNFIFRDTMIQHSYPNTIIIITTKKSFDGFVADVSQLLNTLVSFSFINLHEQTQIITQKCYFKPIYIYQSSTDSSCSLIVVLSETHWFNFMTPTFLIIAYPSLTLHRKSLFYVPIPSFHYTYIDYFECYLHYSKCTHDTYLEHDAVSQKFFDRYSLQITISSLTPQFLFLLECVQWFPEP